jgi:hypothetical protein
MSSFQADLARGQDVEKFILKILQRHYPSASLVNAYKGYDIWIPERNEGIEVKYDPMSNKTGNIVVEYEMSGKDSALLTTEASVWIFYDDHVIISIKPQQIVKCIFDLKLTYREFVGNGDRNSKKAFLVPKEELFKYGKELKR